MRSKRSNLLWVSPLERMRNESWSIFREAGASVLAYKLYPLGIATASIPVLPPLRSIPEKRVPVLFVHGFLHNASTFAYIKQKMRLAGWRDFRAVNLPTLRGTLPEMAEQTLDAITQMRREFGSDQVDIVAHSMGGILARYALQLLKADGQVRKLVTLGTPHQGTVLSRYGYLPSLKELAPESRTMRRLKRAQPLRHTQAVAVSGSLDVLMQPAELAHWEGVRNIRLRGVGHAGLLFSKRVVQIILAHLLPGK